MSNYLLRSLVLRLSAQLLFSTATVVTGLLAGNLAFAQNSHPYCATAGSDSDGDGWGWENGKSCIVGGTTADKQKAVVSNCPPGHQDTDGDGFGWHNGKSCKIQTVCRLQTSDPDGDGYGWENSASCIVTSESRAEYDDCQSATSDPDGDGYGYENGETCLAVVPPTAGANQDRPVCEDADSDPDGDGYGFENGATCLVAAPPTGSATPGNPVCESADSDPDGDGIGWENGRSCDVEFTKTGTTASLADITEVIVITGQSNAFGSLTSFDEVLDAPNQRVFAFTDKGWQIADLHLVWDDHLHPGNNSLTDNGRQPYNNLAFQFAKSVAEKDTSRVPAFIVDADPGKGIANWDYNSSFYRKLNSKVRNALDALPHKSSVDAILWHQGENDWLYEGTSDAGATGFTSEDSNEYKNYYAIKLENLIRNFRNESWARGDTAFICGETRRATGVNRRLMALNADSDPLTGCVPATDLPARSDDPYGSHFSGDGLRTLGQRYADMYLQMIGG